MFDYWDGKDNVCMEESARYRNQSQTYFNENPIHGWNYSEGGSNWWNNDQQSSNIHRVECEPHVKDIPNFHEEVTPSYIVDEKDETNGVYDELNQYGYFHDYSQYDYN